ncbi:hypothetical protein [Halococcus thailandensis]|uniref:DUF7982 domain-containing protein n=1 Tax=Halococcus thailandensis JCM 13552 TaxID=1227457 RepID=M0N577_9EURY|nr:hypothetical protein [Halococcus thailandensis]EMA52284.1 hypothetical protein C451_12080 [Halococcus thailandensis JCM 13552]
MSESESRDRATDADEGATDAEPLQLGDERSTESSELAAQIDVLREENQRLREEYARARRTQYRRTALALAAVGLLATLGGVALPDSRTVLFALGGTGLFAAALTRYLTPEQFISASVGEGIYGSLAATEAALVAELGLQDERLYLPGPDTPNGVSIRLFVPQQSEYDLPSPSALDSVFVVADDEAERGVALHPSGGPLFAEFHRTLSGSLADEPDALAAQLADGLVEQFELARSATPDYDEGQITVAIDGSAYGAIDRIDHPVASFLGVGFAAGLDRAVAVETTAADGDRADFLVTCSWDDA